MSVASGSCYADRAKQREVTIEENEPIARNTYRLRFHFPEMAQQIVPGQFLMVRIAQFDDPLIGRPFALYDTAGDPANRQSVDFVYLVSGKLTQRMARLKPGSCLEVWGPLGNGFATRQTDHLIMVAGGIGQTPFLALAKEHLGLQRYGEATRSGAAARRVTLCYGARSAAYLAGLREFEAAGVELRICTDDGSAGQRGLVTSALQELLQETTGSARHVVACGPEPMLKAVSELTAQFDQPTDVSLETPMACGIGICFSCVAQVRDETGQVDYRRTCIEGPVFDARQICWD